MRWIADLPGLWGIARVEPGMAATDGAPSGRLLLFAESRRLLLRAPWPTAPQPVTIREAPLPEATLAIDGPGDREFSRCMRPVRPGYSLGCARRTGTLGLVVWPASGSAHPLLLSSSHVLNPRPDGRVHQVFQPGGRDRERADSPIGYSLCYTRLSPTVPNRTEAGLAVPLEGTTVDGLGHPAGPVTRVCTEIKAGQTLTKAGRTTGLVHGAVMALDWHGLIRFPHGIFPFERQVVIDGRGCAISRAGDSGGVWITADGLAAAMNIAGSDEGQLSFASPMTEIVRRLNIRLTAPPGAAP